MNFVDSNHCGCRLHCSQCRDMEGGRAWRKSLMKHFRVPGDTVDFECPHGLSWGFSAPAQTITPKPVDPAIAAMG